MGVNNVYEFIKSRAFEPGLAITTKDIMKGLGLGCNSVNKAIISLYKKRGDIKRIPKQWPPRYYTKGFPPNPLPKT